MKKGLVTAFVIASVLAFNACKKEEGPVGPKGDKGEAGAPGAAGAIGPQGVKGDDGANGQDGATIRSDEGAPASSLGNVGDYYFDKTDRLLYGPKTEADGWGAAADAVTLYGPAGAAGADGADGANGTSFTAGAGAPDASIGSEGDFYFDTDESTFYGPKGAIDWSTGSVLPLAATSASTTYYYTAGFNITDEDVSYGEYIDAVYSDYTQFSSYRINAEDVYRMSNYSNWHINREMMFEQTANNGIFNLVPRGAWDFAIEDPTTPGTYIPAATVPSGETSAMIRAGREFKYTGATEVEANNTYTLTIEDITRLAIADGIAFDYLTYAATKREDLALGEPVTFFQTKTLTKKTHTDHFYAEYDAETTIDLNAIVGKDNFERLKKEGAYVFAGYTFFDASDEAEHITGHILASRGYINMTTPATMYFNGGVAYGPNGMYTTDVRQIATPLVGGAGTADLSFNYLAGNPYLSHPTFQTVGSGFGEGQLDFHVGSAAPQRAIPSDVAPKAHYVDGKLHIEWVIESGINQPTARYDVSPLTMTNPTNAAMEGWWEYGVWKVRDFEVDYYSGSRLAYTPAASLLTGALSSIVFDEVRDEYVVIPATGGKTYVNGVNVNRGGLTAAVWEAKPLVRVVVNVVDAEAVAKAQAAGINVNNPEALINFANSLQLQ